MINIVVEKITRIISRALVVIVVGQRRLMMVKGLLRPIVSYPTLHWMGASVHHKKKSNNENIATTVFLGRTNFFPAIEKYLQEEFFSR